MGGSTAIRVALDHPEIVRRLVLVGTGLHGYSVEGSQPALYRDFSDAWTARDEGRIVALMEKIWLAGPARPVEAVAPELRRLFRDMLETHLRARNWEAEPQDRLISDADRLHQLTMPVLVVVGEEDTPEIRMIADLITRTAPNATLHRIRDAAHLPNLEHPHLFNPWLRDWLESTG
jgi:pimeloyl-ACP methyl ester carboxylesterase